MTPVKPGRPRGSRRAWRVRYRRAGWRQAQVRHYFDEQAARRLYGRLSGPTPPRLAPVEFLVFEVAELTPWSEVTP